MAYNGREIGIAWTEEGGRLEWAQGMFQCD
jgi:hypothetical protein